MGRSVAAMLTLVVVALVTSPLIAAAHEVKRDTPAGATAASGRI